MKSDTDCEGASESENTVQTVQKKTAHTPRPDVNVEDQCSDQDEVISKSTLADTGTVMAFTTPRYHNSWLILLKTWFEMIFIQLVFGNGE